mgnify:CR=1 FL=1|jgi:hypothetical protein
MPKTYFHNYQNNEVDEKKDLTKIFFEKKSQNVDINKLLNRVKILKRNKTKEKLIIFGIAILIISLMGTFVLLTK